VRAICDPIAHRAEVTAATWNARVTDGFRALVTSPDIDAILLLSARWYGALPILAACDAGKAVYCAASLELSSEEARQVKERVQHAGVAFMAEFPHRLAPATIRLKELIATHLGQPRLLFCNERRAANRANVEPETANTRQLIEMVDWCRYIVGQEPTSVVGTAHAASDEVDGQDYTLMMLDFSTGVPGSGVVAQIACGSYVRKPWQEATSYRRPADLQVACERGLAFVDVPSTVVWFDDAGQHTESLDSDRPVGEQLLLHFHRAVASLVLSTASLDDAYRALSIVVRARESFATGERVDCRA
jgi:predicted dehydrogenase